MDEHTVLSDLLKLNLHLFEDEVKNIVDKAVKETSMEKVLRELAVTWANMELTHERHPRTGITIIRASEEVVETLEDNQVSSVPICFICQLDIVQCYFVVHINVLY